VAPKAIQRIVAAADLLRPQTFFKSLARINEVADATRELTKQIHTLEVRTAQLMAIEQSDWELRQEFDQLATQLDPARVAAHIAAAVERASLDSDPFPHIVVDNWLPADIYEAMVRGVPPAVFFADREPSRQRMRVPFSMAPAYAQRVWRFISNVVDSSLQNALNEKFACVVRDYVRGFCPDLSPSIDLTLHASDGRIMLRRPGYVIEPHRDPKWGFLTGLVYLARTGDNEAYGTQLYRVRDDGDAPTDKPYYVSADRCELVRSVPFRANTLLVFINSLGAHGASIPADAQPPTLERYVYQFRLGPTSSVIQQILGNMPHEARASWAGAKASRANKST
jgi:hypothetical protein